MTDKTHEVETEQDQEEYCFAVARKLFWYTAVGTILFSGGMAALWYWDGGFFWN